MAHVKVDKLSVGEFLAGSVGKGNELIIPEYQRPYTWKSEEINKLFSDILEFIENSENPSREEYFLGSIVTCDMENGEEAVIDGQQRLTTIFLILKAAYCKLSQMAKDESENLTVISRLQNDIQKVLWYTRSSVDTEKSYFKSKLIDDEHKRDLENILIYSENYYKNETDSQSIYVNNYELIQEKLNELANEFEPKEKVKLLYSFLLVLLNNVYLVAMKTSDLALSLKIFETLNYRGVALSEIDLTKVLLYNKAIEGKVGREKDNAGNDFLKEWNSLASQASKLLADINLKKNELSVLFESYYLYLKGKVGTFDVFNFNLLQLRDRHTYKGKKQVDLFKKIYTVYSKEENVAESILKFLKDVLNIWRIIGFIYSKKRNELFNKSNLKELLKQGKYEQIRDIQREGHNELVKEFPDLLGQDSNISWIDDEILMMIDILATISLKSKSPIFLIALYYHLHKPNGEPSKIKQFREDMKKLMRYFISTILASLVNNGGTSQINSLILAFTNVIVQDPDGYPKKYYEDALDLLDAKETVNPRIDKREDLDSVKFTSSELNLFLLKILAYAKQAKSDNPSRVYNLLPCDLQVEHIFPTKNHKNFSAEIKGVSPAAVKNQVNKLGNLLPLEKLINISSTNADLEFKIGNYKKSGIKLVLEFAEKYSDEGKFFHLIDQRTTELFDELYDIYQKLEKGERVF
ncbi:GmrSD restriction endonuclease domain-containing protein [Psittacicella hinzii]|uniref:DUF262 domain-containing protein n=1 Tax=Psittacicella hinzii TaxID=2028575 RepID=A0A3A1YDY8_9GAMM|nr:DUF262 domain-containing protein [Psittacicella hinzii]RIY34394.1 hypothetical protein CKF58_08205 [Psittacicella hinzii]